MAQLSHAKGGVKVFSGSFLGSSALTVYAGKGTFTVARGGSAGATATYVITLSGPLPKGSRLVCHAMLEDGSMTGATDIILPNVKSAVASTGVVTLQFRDVAGTAGYVDDAAIVHFVVYAHSQTEAVA